MLLLLLHSMYVCIKYIGHNMYSTVMCLTAYMAEWRKMNYVIIHGIIVFKLHGSSSSIHST